MVVEEFIKYTLLYKIKKIKTSQRNTSGDMDYWNSKRYELIREYYLRSPWVPPFNLIGRVHHVISFLKNFFSKCSDAKVSESKFFRKKSEVFKRPMRHRFKNRQDIKKIEIHAKHSIL